MVKDLGLNCGCLVAKSRPTLCDPVDCSLPGSSVHGIFQARILEWAAISFSRGSSKPRDRTRVSHVVGRCFYRLSHRVIAFLLISWLQSPSAVILEPKKIKSLTVSIAFPCICTFTGDTQTQLWLSLCEVSGSWCVQGLFEPSEHLWQVRG